MLRLAPLLALLACTPPEKTPKGMRQDTGSTATIPLGMRAVTMAVPEGTASGIDRGDFVDVIATVVDERNRPRTRVIAEEVKVLDVASASSRDRDSLTLVTSFQTALLIAHARAAGAVRVALRNPTDHGRLEDPELFVDDTTLLTGEFERLVNHPKIDFRFPSNLEIVRGKR